MLSQRKEKNPEDENESIYMSSIDIDIVNNSYMKIKRTRGESIPKKETDYYRDPLYKSIYSMKHRSVRYTKAKSKRNMLKMNVWSAYTNNMLLANIL